MSIILSLRQILKFNQFLYRLIETLVDYGNFNVLQARMQKNQLADFYLVILINY